MTQDELLAIARKGRPTVRYAKSKDGNSIGAWTDSSGRFVRVACLLITGEWASMPYELLVNGQAIPAEWIE